MLYRNKKTDDPCEGKWVGVGGKFEPGETPEQCLLREVREETGLTLNDYKFRGIINFVSDRWPDEDMYLYSASGFDGDDVFPEAVFDRDGNICNMINHAPRRNTETDDNNGKNIYNNNDLISFDCNEGDLFWIPAGRILSLNLWEGDRYFLEPMISGKERIYMTCRYEGHKCVEVKNEEIYNRNE